MDVEPTPHADWARVELGTQVSLSNNGQLLHHGTVVAKTTSGSALWIVAPNRERRMYRNSSGHQLKVEKTPVNGTRLPR